MSKKQTAVDYLIEQLQAPCRGIPSHIVDQAKQMEKEQILKSYNQSWHNRMNPYKTAEKYYNEIYGGTK